MLLVDEAAKFQKELLLFKVDFEKAYDSLDWGYLDAVMGRMSFPFLWTKWIKECVCSATASVLVNGSPTDEFPLERGLRQGDPLSPFMFLLAAEGLNVLMKAMVESNVFTGYTIGTENLLSISHLQFADDTLLLGVKSWANVRALRAVLVLFELMSGLKVNFHKSMLVGVNISDSWLSEAASVLRCRVGKVPFLYLGLPIGGDPSRLGIWEPVVARIKQRLSGWKSRFLSFGGRLILLKWQWKPNLDGGYSVRGAYQLLTSQQPVALDVAEELIWHKQVPLKVSIFAWRLLRDRLPTKANLVARGIITPEFHLCVSGCGGVESAQHLFLSCTVFGSLWSLVRSWIGFSSADSHHLSDHFVQFTYSFDGLRTRRSFSQLIWLACVWVIWTERNQRLFRNSKCSLPQLLDKVKQFSYLWLKTTNCNLVSNYHSWWSSPYTCLGIV
ncbi:hypothetical protein TSUD_402860 [Trifolium subterraneum]|uniref:Reverse transcriptase domain-containing protein n=1 Tax=Trifolium subterraneum TaxID=3900 RepID=A0A2Z6PCP5_TRISU|nr:hypothetical protein TSUD_402860 [Trifolium subterraneum]